MSSSDIRNKTGVLRWWEIAPGGTRNQVKQQQQQQYIRVENQYNNQKVDEPRCVRFDGCHPSSSRSLRKPKERKEKTTKNEWNKNYRCARRKRRQQLQLILGKIVEDKKLSLSITKTHFYTKKKKHGMLSTCTCAVPLTTVTGKAVCRQNTSKHIRQSLFVVRSECLRRLTIGSYDTMWRDYKLGELR